MIDIMIVAYLPNGEDIIIDRITSYRSSTNCLPHRRIPPQHCLQYAEADGRVAKTLARPYCRLLEPPYDLSPEFDVEGRQCQSLPFT
jgi:hypothetical protein